MIYFCKLLLSRNIFDNPLTWLGAYVRIKMSYYLQFIGLHVHKRVLPVCLIKLLIHSLVPSHLQHALPVLSSSMYQLVMCDIDDMNIYRDISACNMI